jgi:hypothetical protein
MVSSTAGSEMESIWQITKVLQRQSLKVNPNKTKVLVFNKAGRHIQEIFMYENKILDCVVTLNFDISYPMLLFHFSQYYWNIVESGVKHHNLNPLFPFLNLAVVGLKLPHISGRHIQEIFMYENKILDCVVNYKYLGLHFSAPGSFSFAQTELHKKTLKAYYYA